jgi:hypothetical protein
MEHFFHTHRAQTDPDNGHWYDPLDVVAPREVMPVREDHATTEEKAHSFISLFSELFRHKQKPLSGPIDNQV